MKTRWWMLSGLTVTLLIGVLVAEEQDVVRGVPVAVTNAVAQLFPQAVIQVSTANQTEQQQRLPNRQWIEG